MKKFLIRFCLILISALFVFTLAGCTTHTGGNNENKPSTDKPSTPVTDKDAFTVTLTLGGEVFVAEEEIYALWTDMTGTYRSEIKNGVAKISGLDGDYQVTLSKTPAGFTYNPNVYVATNNKKDISIELFKINRFTGNGGEWTPYSMSKEGAYRATIKDADTKVWYMFEPKQKGIFSAESWLDVTANVINPKMDVYDGHTQYKEFRRTQDDGGTESSFTKNFRLVMPIAEDEIGGVFNFTVRVDARATSFPVNIDFYIKLETEDYERDDMVYTDVHATEEFPAGRIETPTGTQVMIGSLGVLNSKNYKLNSDGFYYEWNESSKSYGRLLYAVISKDSHLLVTDSGLGFLDGLVRCTCNGKNYNPMIKSEYGAHADEEYGVYPVTQELREFLHAYSLKERFFRDGDGWAEVMGYQSAEADQWLWNCCIFSN